MANRIFIRDINHYHPYTSNDSVDQYYTQLSNKIVKVLDNAGIDNLLDADERKDVAVILALYLEDVVSGTHIWQTFTEECKAMYGSYLPFYSIGEDYFHDEINLEDIRFLLWHHIQLMHRQDNLVINPENPGIAALTVQIMEILDDAYEEAPENERLLSWMQDVKFNADSFDRCFNILLGFQYSCYLCYESQYFVVEQKDEFLTQLDESMNANIDHDAMRRALRVMVNLQERSVINMHRNLLAYSSAEWAEKILSHHTDTTLLRDMKIGEIMPYQFISGEGNKLELKTIVGKEETLTVNAPTSEVNRCLKSNLPYVSCQLIWYGGAWWACGSVDSLTKEECEVDLEEIKQRDMKIEGAAHTAKLFMKASDGERLVFCKNREELLSFLTDKLELNFSEGLELQDMDVDRGIAVYCTEKDGLGFLVNQCEVIASPHNPYYNKEKAKEKAIALILNDISATYSLAQILWKEGYLPDAAMKSVKGYNHGRKFFADNADFLIDYFHYRGRDENGL